MFMAELQMGFSGMERDDWIQPYNHGLEITLIIDHLSHFVFWFGLFLITEIAINLISSMCWNLRWGFQTSSLKASFWMKMLPNWLLF